MAHPQIPLSPATIARMLRQHQAKQIKGDNFAAIKVNNFTRDIFIGIGWTRYSRYISNHGNIIHVAGVTVPSSVLKAAFQ